MAKTKAKAKPKAAPTAAKPDESTTPPTRLLVYGGVWLNHDKALRHIYWPTDEDWRTAELPERSAYALDMGLEGKWLIYKSVLAKHAAVGAVLRVSVDPENHNTVTYKVAPEIVGYIDDATRAVWRTVSQATYDGHRLVGKAKKEKGRDFVQEALVPIRQAYNKCKNPAARRALLARVLEGVTGSW